MGKQTTVEQLGERLAGLEAQRTALQGQRDPLADVEQEIAGVKADLDAARVEAQQAAVAALRPVEAAAWQKLIAATDALWAEVEACQEVWREIELAGGSPRTGLPVPLYMALKPGLSGGRQYWADRKL